MPRRVAGLAERTSRIMDMIDDTRDIRITRLEGRVKTLEDVQGAILDKMDVLIANQNKIIELIQALTLEVADLKDRVIAPGDNDS